MARAAARFCAALKPLARPAMTMLAASRLTSHSQGPGSVSSKSLASKTRRPLGRREEAEVREVGVAARLHDDVGPGRRREVGCHHRRRAAVVGEGRLGHARVPQRDQVGQPIRLLSRQDGDRVPAGAGLEGAWLTRARACARGDPDQVARTDGPTAGRSRSWRMLGLGSTPLPSTLLVAFPWALAPSPSMLGM